MIHASSKSIVTGASHGIERAVATRLARDCFAVAVNYAGNATKAELVDDACSIVDENVIG